MLDMFIYSLLEALDLIAKGAQNLVVPITRKTIHNVTQVETAVTLKPHMASVNLSILLPKDHGGQEYCWLTVEDVLRFLLGSIGVFSPLPAMSIEALGLIGFDVQMIEVEQAACSALEAIKLACQDSSAVAVVDSTKASPGAIRFVGDISCSALQTCNELASLALLTLSAEDFLAFLEDCRKPPQVLVDMIHSRVCEILGLIKGKSSYIEPLTSKPESTTFLLHKLEMWGESSSSEDDEYGCGSPTGPHDLAHKWHSKHPCSSRKGFSFRNQSGPSFCSPDSSLMAVLLQALAHREHYVWVTREDNLLIGIVNIRDILGVMFNHIMMFI
ncbi:hypothetical protein KP509_32G007400 [Ceratopteris richardii]|uniref:CBS domain-containing protein n=2 Tax=Ceratopteris richardii TaxID=49495 RepID=A0A8T2QQI3_CERRI|nr:hypothetical protein KP509_32G007400 [Ceratopteris richardii]